MPPILRRFGLVSLSWLAACGDASQAPDFATVIAPIVQNHCTGCHSSGGLAPFALRTYGDVFAHRQSIAQATSERTMPPWHAQAGHRQYLHDPSLSSQQIESLARWAATARAQDMPADTALSAPDTARLPGVDLVLRMPAPYAPSGDHDDYRCFVLDWPQQTTTFVTAIDVAPGNRSLVHHAIAYMAYPDGASYAAALDAADPGPGYACFGGPGQISAKPYQYGSLGGWVPGYGPVTFPPGTGIRVEPGAKIVLQVHYNLESGSGTDQTTVELALADAVQREGFYIAWLNGYWTLPEYMPIPAHTWTKHEFVASPFPYFEWFANVPVDSRRAFLIHSAIVHMHARGVTGEVFVKPEASVEESMLLRITRWDYHWQREYQFVQPVTFGVDDKLGVRCHWDNTEANQPVRDGVRQRPRDLAWGEGTDDEMCVAFMYTTAL